MAPESSMLDDIIMEVGLRNHQDIADMDEAYSALTRIKAEGGPASFSYKNYQLPHGRLDGKSRVDSR